MSNGRNVLHKHPGVHGLYMIDNAVEDLPDHAKHGRLTYKAVVHQNQAQRQLRKYGHEAAVELELRRPTAYHRTYTRYHKPKVMR